MIAKETYDSPTQSNWLTHRQCRNPDMVNFARLNVWLFLSHLHSLFEAYDRLKICSTVLCSSANF